MKTERLAQILWAVERISGNWEMESQARAGKWSEIGEEVRNEYRDRARRFKILKRMPEPGEQDYVS